MNTLPAELLLEISDYYKSNGPAMRLTCRRMYKNICIRYGIVMSEDYNLIQNISLFKHCITIGAHLIDDNFDNFVDILNILPKVNEMFLITKISINSDMMSEILPFLKIIRTIYIQNIDFVSYDVLGTLISAIKNIDNIIFMDYTISGSWSMHLIPFSSFPNARYIYFGDKLMGPIMDCVMPRLETLYQRSVMYSIIFDGKYIHSEYLPRIHTINAVQGYHQNVYKNIKKMYVYNIDDFLADIFPLCINLQDLIFNDATKWPLSTEILHSIPKTVKNICISSPFSNTPEVISYLEKNTEANIKICYT